MDKNWTDGSAGNYRCAVDVSTNPISLVKGSVWRKRADAGTARCPYYADSASTRIKGVKWAVCADHRSVLVGARQSKLDLSSAFVSAPVALRTKWDRDAQHLCMNLLAGDNGKGGFLLDTFTKLVGDEDRFAACFDALVRWFVADSRYMYPELPDPSALRHVRELTDGEGNVTKSEESMIDFTQLMSHAASYRVREAGTKDRDTLSMEWVTVEPSIPDFVDELLDRIDN